MHYIGFKNHRIYVGKSAKELKAKRCYNVVPAQGQLWLGYIIGDDILVDSISLTLDDTMIITVDDEYEIHVNDIHEINEVIGDFEWNAILEKPGDNKNNNEEE